MMNKMAAIIALLFLFAPFARADGIVLTDEHMNVLYSEDSSIAQTGETLNLLISPYAYKDIRIAVLLDDDMEVARCFVTGEKSEPLGDSPIFPELLPEAYVRAHEYYDELEGLTSDLWYYLAKDIQLKRLDRLALVDFVNWEKNREMDAAGARLTYLPISDERRLFYFYSNPNLESATSNNP